MDGRDTSQLQFGKGSALWDYWTKGEGLAKWSGAAHKWTTLHRLLREAGVPAREVDGLTTNIIEHVMPGYMKTAHAKKRDAQGDHMDPVDPDMMLDGSWDNDLSDLPDLNDVTVADLEEAEQYMGDMGPMKQIQPGRSADRAGSMAVGGGGRFAKLKAALAAKGAHDPGGLASWIGRKKYGKAGFAALAAAARRRKKRSASVDEMFVRAFTFETRSSGDGRTLEGYAAVFNSPTKIRDMVGEFEEIILPGAFTRSLEKRTPVLQFEHGRDPRVGAVPIGKIEDIREDDKGLYVRARLFANDTVEPVREAIAAKAINGMSFRFGVPKGGDVWSTRKGDLDLREIREADTSECGPVVFPAYDQTSVTVRSLLAQLDPAEHRTLIRELADEVRQAVDLSGDLSDFTGRPGARSAGGGDSGEEPGNGETPPSQQARTRDRVLRMKGIV